MKNHVLVGVVFSLPCRFSKSLQLLTKVALTLPEPHPPLVPQTSMTTHPRYLSTTDLHQGSATSITIIMVAWRGTSMERRSIRDYHRHRLWNPSFPMQCTTSYQLDSWHHSSRLIFTSEVVKPFRTKHQP